MGSPAIFSGKFTKLLTQLGLMLSNGAVINNDGEKNYIGYATFENGATTGWSLGTTGTLTNGIPTGTPTFGSGASGTLALTAQSTGPLSGSYSLQLADSAATTAGNMVATSALAIDLEGQARVLTWEFYYKCSANPTNGNFSGTSANTFGVAAYDVTNSAWLPTCGNFNIIQNSGVGYSTGTLQTSSTTASIRFVIYCANASSGAITMLFDDFYFGPITAPTGSATTDWQSYTPVQTNTTNVSGNAGYWRRVGDSIEITGRSSWSGVGAGSTWFVTLPSGLTIDTAKTASVAADTTFGIYEWRDSGTNFRVGTVVYSNSTQVAFNNDSATGFLNGTDFASGDSLNYNFKVPVTGWSSNVIMSSDTDTRIVAARFKTSNARTVNNTFPNIVYETVDYDTHGAYNSSTGVYTIPVSGYYRVSGAFLYAAVASTIGFSNSLLLKKAGASIATIAQCRVQTTSSTNIDGTGSTAYYFNAGDQVSIGGYADTANTTFAGTSAQNNVSIERLSGPATIAATETVAFSASKNAGSLANSTNAIVNSWTQVNLNTHGTAAFDSSTGVFTAPVSGTYVFSGSVAFASGVVSGFANFVVDADTSTAGKSFNLNGNSTASCTCFAGVTPPIRLRAGQTVAIYAFQSSGGALNYATNSAMNPVYFGGHRIGN
jgi:hypothetical protein